MYLYMYNRVNSYGNDICIDMYKMKNLKVIVYIFIYLSFRIISSSTCFNSICYDSEKKIQEREKSLNPSTYHIINTFNMNAGGSDNK